MSIYDDDLKFLKPIEIEAADELSKILPKGVIGPLEVRRLLTSIIDERKKTKTLKKKVKLDDKIVDAAYRLIFALEDGRQNPLQEKAELLELCQQRDLFE